MFYNNSQRTEIEQLENSQDLFNILIQPDRKGTLPFWYEIMEGIQYYFNYNEHNKEKLPKYIFKNEDLNVFRNIGMDFNFRDASDNAFIHYVYGLSKGGRDKNIVFWDDIKFELAKATKNFDKNNKYNQNVLFDLMTYVDGGVKGENFFKILEEFPNLNINVIDNQERNLLFSAIMNPAPFNVINFLIDSGVNILQIDKDGNNLLNMFMLMGVSKESKPIFELIFESLENIGTRNKYGDNFLDSILLGITYNKSQDHIVKRDTEWFEVFSEKIIKGEFNKTVECLESLKKSMEKHSEQDLWRLSIENRYKYKKTLTALNYFKLDLDVPEEANSVVNKQKLKI